MNIRWHMRQSTPAGDYKIATTGKEPLDIVVDKNGFFETEGLPDHLLYALAKRAPLPTTPSRFKWFSMWAQRTIRS